jgi:hypothetical protein
MSARARAASNALIRLKMLKMFRFVIVVI